MKFIILASIITVVAVACLYVRTCNGLAEQRNAYAQWKNGPPSDPSYFPIAVWLQDPKNAPRFKAAGINLYVGLWRGPTDAQLAALKSAGMPVICDQNKVGLAHKDDPTIVAWMHGDEPDNAQPIIDPATGQRTGWGSPVPPSKIVADYEKMRASDPTRPVLLNLGQGVANDEWKGRGSGAHLDDYLTYVKGSDIVSYDVYPVVGINKPDGENYLWYVAKGVDRLIKWSEGKKIIWNCIECTHISQEDKKATPHQVRAEVWMSLIHGSTGLIYFVHQFKPRFIEAALLEDSEMLTAVTAINKQIHELAPVLNSPTVKCASPKPLSENLKEKYRKWIDEMIPGLKEAAVDYNSWLVMGFAFRHNGATYVFAVGMRNAPAKGAFEVRGLPATATAEVIGENRHIAVRGGKFEDAFKAYDVHLYRIR